MTNILIRFSILISLTFLSIEAFSQIGCTDSDACNFDPTAVVNDGTCDYGLYYVPFEVGSGPMVQSCDEVSGYWLPDQDIVEQILQVDVYCLNVSWDLTCQQAYDDALGCEAEPSWYIPYNYLDYIPPVYSCSPPVGYMEADMDCLSQIVADDPFCLGSYWDITCTGAYNTCLHGCADPLWYVPIEYNSSPPVQSCSPLAGHIPVTTSIFIVFDQDPYCVDNNWDNICYEGYIAAEFGCEAEWFVPTFADGENVPVLACNPPLGYSSVLNQECFIDVLLNDSFCLTTGWDLLCQETYESCISGCTYEWACNYSQDALLDDGSCGVPGCTNSSALNFNPSAACDDGSCVFGASSCPGDFTNDQFVNASDLLSFLAVFGHSCQ